MYYWLDSVPQLVLKAITEIVILNTLVVLDMRIGDLKTVIQRLN
jgi:hypothetical protein